MPSFCDKDDISIQSPEPASLLAILATLEPLDEEIGEIADFPPQPFDLGS